MRLLVAPDCFTGTLTSIEAARAMAEGWRRHAPLDELDLCPLSDGGPGFLTALGEGLAALSAGEPVRLSTRVTGPVGHPVPARILLGTTPDRVRTAYLETAQACGAHLVPPGRRDPRRTSTAGVGELLLRARAAGARRIVLGLGGSGTNDAGAGMLHALLAAEPVPDVPAGWACLARGGGALAGLSSADLAPLAVLQRRWEGTELVIAADVDVPLLGLHGASAGFAQQKGATAEQAQELERCLGDFAAGAAGALGIDRAVAKEPASGAAGGLGFGLRLLGAGVRSGVDEVAAAVRLGERARSADLVLTGEGRFDWQSLRGKVVAGVSRAAAEAGRPVVVVAGQVDIGPQDARALGITATYPVATTQAEIAAAMADPAGTLAARVERVARNWSR